MESFIDKRCQYCGQELLITDGVYTCSDCGAHYHQSCWAKNGGCTTPGCSKRPADSASEIPTGQSAGSTPTSNTDDIPPSPAKPNLFCANCHAPLGAGEKFCQHCGYSAVVSSVTTVPPKPQGKSKKVVIILIVIAAVVLVLSAVIIGAVFAINNFRRAAVQDYIDDAEEFSYQILTSGANLENIGNEMRDNWYDYIYDDYTKYSSPMDAVDDAWETMASEVADVKSGDSVITDLYTSLKASSSNDNDDLAEIRVSIDDLYDAYHEFYSCVLEPTGNYAAFTSHFSDTDDALLEEYQDLERLLSDYIDD